MSNILNEDGLHVLARDTSKNQDLTLDAILQGINALNAAVSNIPNVLFQITAQYSSQFERVLGLTTTAFDYLSRVGDTMISNINAIIANLPELWSRADAIIALTQDINDNTVPAAYQRIDEVVGFLNGPLAPAIEEVSRFLSGVETMGSNWINQINELDVVKSANQALEQLIKQGENGHSVLENMSTILNDIVKEDKEGNSTLKDICSIIKSINEQALVKKISDFLEQATVLLGALRNIWNFWEGVLKSIGDFFKAVGTNIGGFFKSIGTGIGNFFTSFFKDYESISKPWYVDYDDLHTFASGGIVSGPTLAYVGEYAGARNNPEVIAPLSKLQGMLDSGSGQDYVASVLYEIADKLEGAIERNGNIYLDSDKLGERLLNPIKRAQQRRGSAVLAF